MKIKLSLILTVLVSLILSSCMVQESDSEKDLENAFPYQIDDTRYELPYLIPDEEGITEVLERMYNLISSSTHYRVINKVNGEEITDFSVPDSNAIVDSRDGSYNLWDYTVGVIHTGMFACWEVLQDPKYREYPLKNYDFIMEKLPYFREKARLYGVERGGYHRIIEMEALDHCGSIGAALVQANGYKKDPLYMAMIDTVAEYITNEQFRMEDGTLARQRPQEVSLWTDDFYMSIPFLARMGEYSGDQSYWEDAVKQVLQLSDRLFVWDKELYDHGWNECAGEYDPRYYWARANGWAMMANATLLEVLPEDFPGREEILKIYRTHAKGIAERLGGNGMWHNMLDRTDTYSESSSTAMFVYGLAKGVNEGWIDHTYASVAQAGWNGLTMYITPEGRINNMCAGTTFSPDLVYYYHRPKSHSSLHGFGAAFMAGSEMIKLLRNDDLQVIKQWRTYHYRTGMKGGQ